MLSPRAVRLLLRHFDSLDQVVAKRMIRKRPWPEEALTSLLLDLMDGDTQVDENVGYNIRMLHDDFARLDEPVGLSLRIESHSYPRHLERWVTQADFGMIINYADELQPRNSSTTAWLLQAKRLFPAASGRYEESARFESIDSDQNQRMKLLRDWAGDDFIRYFLYCPRPKALHQPVRDLLSLARTAALSDEIFDFTLGLELRDDILSDSPTTAAGLFVAQVDDTPRTLVDVHGAIFSGTLPFSWFVLGHLAEGRGSLSLRGLDGSARQPSRRRLDLERIVRGDHRVLEGFDMPESLGQGVAPRILPAHTLEISVVCGLERPR